VPSGAQHKLEFIERSFRRALLGYRPAEVERALAEAGEEASRQAEYAQALQARSEQLEAIVEHARRACIDRDRRVAYLQAELDLARADSASRLSGLAALGAELERLRIAARGQATRIRLEALREAAAVSEVVAELRTAPDDAFDRLLRSIEAALGRVGGEATGSSATPPVNGAPAPSPNGDASAHNGRRISVDIGPFSDFSQLVTFEDAANAIGATGEISIRRFSQGRASIDVDLSEPVDLLRELEERCDLEFRVRARSDDEIILDLGE
jgi:hypothetical protein